MVLASLTKSYDGKYLSEGTPSSVWWVKRITDKQQYPLYLQQKETHSNPYIHLPTFLLGSVIQCAM